jgi:hypothetical protein
MAQTDETNAAAEFLKTWLPGAMKLTVTTSDPESISGYYDAGRGCWVKEIRHPDGRLERFLLQWGELFEDHP